MRQEVIEVKKTEDKKIKNVMMKGIMVGARCARPLNAETRFIASVKYIFNDSTFQQLND
jgi:hypothetical protein